jgi:hypothetical protein
MWGKPEPTTLPNPNSKIHAIRMSTGLIALGGTPLPVRMLLYTFEGSQLIKGEEILGTLVSIVTTKTTLDVSISTPRDTKIYVA